MFVSYLLLGALFICLFYKPVALSWLFESCVCQRQLAHINVQDGKERSKHFRLTTFWVWFRVEKRTVPAVKNDDNVVIKGVLFLILVPLLK